MAVKTKRTSNGNDPSLAESVPIDLVRIRRETIEVPITGLSPLIPHKWSEKARAMMLAKQQGKPTPTKAPKDPAAEAAAATYWIGNTPGMPATAFKSAIADATRYFEGKDISAVLAKQALFVVGDGEEQLVPINGKITMREDQPRNSGGTADLRYRNQVWPWDAVLTIQYVASKFTREAVVALVDAAGMGGVGDWRPSSPRSKSGTFGRWEVSS